MSRRRRTLDGDADANGAGARLRLRRVHRDPQAAGRCRGACAFGADLRALGGRTRQGLVGAGVRDLDVGTPTGEPASMRLQVVTEIGLDEPEPGQGFVTWLDVWILPDEPDDED